MTIEEAVNKLQDTINEPDVFIVRHNGKEIVVDVNFIYRAKEVVDIGEYEGYKVVVGRKSCW